MFLEPVKNNIRISKLINNIKTNNNMKELSITKAIISDSKVIVALDYPIKDDVGKALDF